MNAIPLPQSGWDTLTPELVRRIAECLHPNDVASSLKLANSDTAAALSDYRTLYLAHDGKEMYTRLKAQQPWPGHAFVAHWGRPEPWRELSLRQRERLLCLAASSGHAASLDAALDFSGCALKPSVLTAAAVGGDELASKRLLAEGCSLDEGVFRAAARGGHLRLLQLLLHTTVSKYLWTPCLAAAAQGACAGGQLAILTWLQQEHGYSLRGSDVGAAAAAGHVELVERLMPLVPDCAPAQEAWKDCDPQDFQAVRDLRCARWELLMDVVRGCPVEVLQRHHDRLWHWPRRQPVLLPDGLANPAALAAAVAAGYAGAEAAGVLAGGRADLEAVVEADVPEDEDQLFIAEDVRTYLCNLFRAAACSPTPCWAAKLSFLLSTWGPRVAATLKAGRFLDLGALFDAMATERPDYLQRLKHLAEIGVALDSQAAEAAFASCRVEALVWLVDECDALRDGVGIDSCIIMRGTATEASDCVGVLEALRQRGWVFEARYLARSPIFGWPDAALLWLAEVGEDADAESPEGATAPTAGDVRAWWSRIFTRAAQEGASLPVLQALRARGAAVDLAAVAQAGGEAALAWAAAQLLAEGAEAAAGAAGSGGGGGMTLQPLSRDEALRCYHGGNVAALDWLRSHGLLPPLSCNWLPTLREMLHGKICQCSSFWSLQLWVRLQLQLQMDADQQAVGGPPQQSQQLQRQQPAAAATVAAADEDEPAAEEHPMQPHGLAVANSSATGNAAASRAVSLWLAAKEMAGRADRVRRKWYELECKMSGGANNVDVGLHEVVALEHQHAWMERQAERL